jgi:hypothetical protein
VTKETTQRMKRTNPRLVIVVVSVFLSSPAEPTGVPRIASASVPAVELGTTSLVEAGSPTAKGSLVFQSNKGLAVQYVIPDGGEGEVFNHASGTADAFFQFTPRPGSDGEFQILVYGGSDSELLTRTFAVPGYAPIITVPPKARVVLKDPMDEDSSDISGLVTVG